MKIKSPNKSGKRVVINCKECKCDYSALAIKVTAGKEKFCSNECYKNYRKSNSKDKKYLNKIHQKKYKYGITEEEYLQMFLNQKNSCKICQTPFSDESRYTLAVVDHCHETGKVRGLLCQRCNRALGGFKDSLEILKNCISYLENCN